MGTEIAIYPLILLIEPFVFINNFINNSIIILLVHFAGHYHFKEWANFLFCFFKGEDRVWLISFNAGPETLPGITRSNWSFNNFASFFWIVLRFFYYYLFFICNPFTVVLFIYHSSVQLWTKYLQYLNLNRDI